jgi:4-alpha-glucanotransferase
LSRLLDERRAGVLLHPTSLPGPGATGTLGAAAWAFVDWLAAGGFSVWQTLPLGPVDSHGSPYCQRSAYAGDLRLLDAPHAASLRQMPRGLDVAALGESRETLYRSFAANASAEQSRAFARFVRRERRWLLPHGVFELCSARFDGLPWWAWPDEFRERRSPVLLEFLAEDREHFRAVLFEQYLFELQWSALKRYANERGVAMFGDLPFYMDLNSVEVWWDRRVFALDSAGRPLGVAGVPPDYFNADGQLWGNPLYDWDALAASHFDWWLDRLRGQLHRFDLLRIDHFRALESYWEVRAGAATAREGQWRKAPGAELLTALRASLGEIPLVVEDLGMITDEVRELRDRFELPGMVVLQFAFDGKPDNPHLPANHRTNSVVYTGTHDNDTTLGWYASLDEAARGRVQRALGGDGRAPMPDSLIDAAYESRARLAMIPLQDLLGLGDTGRMNSPGTVYGNWSWRFSWDEVDASIVARSHRRAELAGRLPARGYAS